MAFLKLHGIKMQLVQLLLSMVHETMVARSMEIFLVTTHFNNRLHYSNMVGKWKDLVKSIMMCKSNTSK